MSRLTAAGLAQTVVRRSANLLLPRSRHTDFLILCSPRTGSTYLRSLLASHPNIRMYGELFAPWRLQAYPWPTRWPVQYLRHEVFACYPARIRAVGFKLLYDHGRDGLDGMCDTDLAVFPEPVRKRIERIWKFLRARRDLRVIHLVRQNAVRQAVSEALARMTHQWFRHNWQRVVGPMRPVELDPDDLVRRIEYTARAANTCRAAFREHKMIEVQYEDLRDKPELVLSRILGFLDLPRARLRSTFVRQNPQPLQLVLSNYDELARRLDGTPWGEQLRQ